jgi:hypothetical protein
MWPINWLFWKIVYVSFILIGAPFAAVGAAFVFIGTIGHDKALNCAERRKRQTHGGAHTGHKRL